MYGMGWAQSCIASHYYLYAAEKGIDEMIQSNINTTRDIEFRLEQTASLQQTLVDQLDHFGGILGEEDQLVKGMKQLADPPKQPGTNAHEGWSTDQRDGRWRCGCTVLVSQALLLQSSILNFTAAVH